MKRLREQRNGAITAQCAVRVWIARKRRADLEERLCNNLELARKKRAQTLFEELETARLERERLERLERERLVSSFLPSLPPTPLASFRFPHYAVVRSR